MTASRDRDARIAAYFATQQPDLPDRAFDAVRGEISRTRQLVVVGPLREPAALRRIPIVVAAAAGVAIAILVIQLRPGIGPGQPPSPAPTMTAVPSPFPSTMGPTTFTSPLYGYTVTVPAGWAASQALLRWDGTTQPGPDAETDKFDLPGPLLVHAFAGRFSGDLDAFVADRIVANHRDHADTCPVAEPDDIEPTRINDQSWVILSWNCGALINQAVTVRDGIAYAFVFRDLAIEAATDPTDRAIFRSILDSVELPN